MEQKNTANSFETLKPNKTTKALKVMKIVIFVVSLVALCLFTLAIVWAKIDYVNNSADNSWAGLGLALLYVIILLYGGIGDGVLLIASVLGLIISLVSKSQIVANKNNALSQEEQTLLIETRKKDVKHFTLLIFLPLVCYLVTFVLGLVIIN